VPGCHRIEIDDVSLGYWEADFGTLQNTIYPVYVLGITYENEVGASHTAVYMPAVAPPLEVTIGAPSNGLEVSHGTLVTFSGSVVGGLPPYVYAWASDHDGPLGTGASIDARLHVNLSEGQVHAHTVSLRVTDQTGMYAQALVEVTVVAPSGDLDGDGDVDLDDYAILWACLAGPGVTVPPEGCLPGQFARADLQGDNDVDLADFGAFANLFTGPGVCGNGVVEEPEQCDAGGESATCDTDCTLAICGDGTLNVTAGEQCDTAGESAACNADCTLAACGDHKVNRTAGEECDDGGESATCDADCTVAVCGDGTTNATAGEDCDDGGESATCNTDCTVAVCGDSKVNHTAGEECDDGGQSASCDANCTAAWCGDGTLNTAAGEQCDDGNTNNGDGCSAACIIEPPPLPDCTVSFDTSCPNAAPVCGASFSGGAGCVNTGSCAQTPPRAYEVYSGPPLTITLSGDLNRLQVMFSGYAGSSGVMTFRDAQGVQVDAPLYTNGNCQSGPPPLQLRTFSRPVRSIQVIALSSPVWIDSFHVNPP
jgi:cysteine-rich repeat protein